MKHVILLQELAHGVFRDEVVHVVVNVVVGQVAYEEHREKRLDPNRA